MQWVSMQESEIASALVGLFQAFAQQAQGQGNQEIDPTPLRKALSDLPGGRFCAGKSSGHVLWSGAACACVAVDLSTLSCCSMDALNPDSKRCSASPSSKNLHNP